MHSDSPQHGLFAPSLMQDIRSRFAFVDRCPFLGPRDFLDSASGSLRLREISRVMDAEGVLPDQVNRDTPGSQHVMQTIARGEDDVRIFLGAPGVVVPSLTATLVLFRTIGDAVAHFGGSNVVTTNLDHPATYDSLRRAAEVHGREFRTADPCPRTGIVEVDAITDLVDADTSVLAFIHGSNVTGAYLDAAEVVRRARSIREDICIIIDGVQYAPYAPSDVAGIDPDVYVIAPYKTYGKKGIAFALLSERFSQVPHGRILGKPEDDWQLGSADHLNYAAWSAVVDYFSWLGGHFTSLDSRRDRVRAGMSAIKSHVKGLLHRLLEGSTAAPGLRSMEGVDLYALEGTGDRSCVVAMNIRGMDPVDAARAYMDRSIVVQARRSVMSRRQLGALGVEGDGIVRVSAAHYTSQETIDRFLEATTEIVGNA